MLNLNLSLNNSTPKPYGSFNEAYRQTPLAPVLFDNGRYGTSIYNTTTGMAGYEVGQDEGTGSLNSIGNPVYSVVRNNERRLDTGLQVGMQAEFALTCD